MMLSKKICLAVALSGLSAMASASDTTWGEEIEAACGIVTNDAEGGIAFKGEGIYSADRADWVIQSNSVYNGSMGALVKISASTYSANLSDAGSDDSNTQVNVTGEATLGGSVADWKTTGKVMKSGEYSAWLHTDIHKYVVADDELAQVVTTISLNCAQEG